MKKEEERLGSQLRALDTYNIEISQTTNKTKPQTTICIRKPRLPRLFGFRRTHGTCLLKKTRSAEKTTNAESGSTCRSERHINSRAHELTIKRKKMMFHLQPLCFSLSSTSYLSNPATNLLPRC